jgi:uncharacterized repeat protein (TIGR03843 family)
MALDKVFALNTLQKGNLQLQGQFLSGSNYTFMTEVMLEEIKMTAVYKPVRGEQPLWDFPAGSLCKREVAAFEVSELLGWDLVPPTIFRRKGPLGAGSLQEFIEADPEYHYFKFSQEDRQRLRPVALFDLLINNADRKGGHILKDADGHLWLIDHGICFHTEDKLRTVVWDFAGEPIPRDLLSDLCRLTSLEEAQRGVAEKLEGLLRSSEISMLIHRAQHLADLGVFPTPLGSRRSYPWPPV